MTPRILALAIVLSIGLCLSGCPRKKSLAPPPGFLPGSPVVTGDPVLDARVAKARELATLDEAGIESLHRLAGEGDEQAISDLVQLQIGRGNTAGALSTLRDWVSATGYSERAMASYLDLALGANQSEECLRASAEYLQRHPNHPFLYITRGLCLTRMKNMNAAGHFYMDGLGRIGNMGGFTGALERELGLSNPGNLPRDAIHRERLDLLAFLAENDLIGYVVVRHIVQFDEEQAPTDPRLVPPGGVASEDLARIFLGRRDAFRHCQKLFSTPRWIPGGRLVLNVTIGRDGAPRQVERTRNTFDVEGIAQCLEDQVMNLWFPQPRHGRGVVYEREFRMVGD